MENPVTSGDKVFSIPEILEEVFGFLRLPDLKSVRLVSSAWRDIAAPVARRKAVVKLDDVGMTPFLAFDTTPMDPVSFRNYKLLYLDVDVKNEMVAFFERYGPSIQSLELRLVTMVGVEIVRDILFNFCPNLKSINIKNCYFYDSLDPEGDVTAHKGIAPLDENVRVNTNLTTLQYASVSGSGSLHDLPISWEDVFIAFPNLKSLEFDDSTSKMNAMLEIARCLKIKKPNMQKLFISFGDGETDEGKAGVLDNIYSLQLSLKELSIELGISMSCQKNLSRLLHQQMNMEKLKLYHHRHVSVPMAGFSLRAQFNHLRYLRTPDIFPTMEFLQHMPNLSTLSLIYPRLGPGKDNNVITRTPINFTETPFQIKLTTVRIRYKISTENVKKLVFWFPGITKAKLYLDDEGFRPVCGGWSKLEELWVKGHKLTTKGITGISEPKVEIRTESLTDIIQTERNPINITCLTNLRKLIVSLGDKPTGTDDICVDEGFLKHPRLNYLNLRSTGISDEGWRKLFKWDQLLTLTPYNGELGWEGREAFKKRI